MHLSSATAVACLLTIGQALYVGQLSYPSYASSTPTMLDGPNSHWKSDNYDVSGHDARDTVEAEGFGRPKPHIPKPQGPKPEVPKPQGPKVPQVATSSSKAKATAPPKVPAPPKVSETGRASGPPKPSGVAKTSGTNKASGTAKSSATTKASSKPVASKKPKACTKKHASKV